jgi:hypothetical protein
MGMVGCQGVVGPLQYRQPKRVDDPFLPIQEQQKLGRDQLALPIESYEAGPPTGMIPQNVFSR